jgi:hypothetical protein
MLLGELAPQDEVFTHKHGILCISTISTVPTLLLNDTGTQHRKHLRGITTCLHGTEEREAAVQLSSSRDRGFSGTEVRADF